ncbi:MAG: hydrogenase formation protein HypD [Phycisphaerae bacterium]|nr:hydrogenase formation protein HypD [Phycisphaerae bacterium]
MTRQTNTAIRQQCDRIDQLCRQALELSGSAGPLGIMEVCGTHTMCIARSGLSGLLSDNLKLISGPGCPVCVTDQSYIDRALHLAMECEPRPIIATYGDMVRVPGSGGSLAEARASGARVEVVYSADQAVEIALANGDTEVVFLAVGFETTAPGAALAVLRAHNENVPNFSIMTAQKLILPAMEALLSQEDVRIDGFLCPGHVSVIIGWKAYASVAAKYARPCVVAGFDAPQVLASVEAILAQLASGRTESASVYPSVSAEGNARALELLDEVFVASEASWRGLGAIPESGMELREAFGRFDAAVRFGLPDFPSREIPGCRCGDVICGRLHPTGCGLFGSRCTPRRAVGPCMVSSEGACAAAYKYGPHDRGPRQ